MSCIESTGERSNFFRNRSFTLFKNDRDFKFERSDSAAVSEFISISMTNSLDTGLSVLVPDISPDFLTWEDHFSSMLHSEEFDELEPQYGLPVPVCCKFYELRSTFWLPDLVFPVLSEALGLLRVFRCSRCKHGRICYTASRYQICHRLWFCCDSFLHLIFFAL